MFQVAGWADAYVDPAFRIQERCRERASVRTHRRQLGPLLPGRRLPGPEHRLAPRARPVLRPLPQGRPERLGGRARARPGSSTSTRSRSRSPRRGRADGGRPPPFPVAGDGRARRWHLGAGTLPAASRPRPTASTRSRTSRDRRHERRALVGRGLAPQRPRARPPARRGPRPRPTRASRCARTLSVIGVPEVVLHLTATMPVATCVVRLSEVASRPGPPRSSRPGSST